MEERRKNDQVETKSRNDKELTDLLNQDDIGFELKMGFEPSRLDSFSLDRRDSLMPWLSSSNLENGPQGVGAVLRKQAIKFPEELSIEKELKKRKVSISIKPKPTSQTSKAPALISSNSKTLENPENKSKPRGPKIRGLFSRQPERAIIRAPPQPNKKQESFKEPFREPIGIRKHPGRKFGDLKIQADFAPTTSSPCSPLPTLPLTPSARGILKARIDRLKTEIKHYDLNTYLQGETHETQTPQGSLTLQPQPTKLTPKGVKALHQQLTKISNKPSATTTPSNIKPNPKHLLPKNPSMALNNSLNPTNPSTNNNPPPLNSTNPLPQSARSPAPSISFPMGSLSARKQGGEAVRIVTASAFMSPRFLSSRKPPPERGRPKKREKRRTGEGFCLLRYFK